MSVNEWDNEYARLARIASQLRSSSSSSPAGTPAKHEYQQQQQQQQQQQGNDNQTLNMQLQRLEQQLDELPVSPAEIQRRRRLIQHLVGQTTKGNSNSNNNNNNAGTAAAAGYYPPNSNNSNSNSGGDNNNNNANPQMSSQMAYAMRQQDDMIDDLAVGVGRLRDQTQLIGEEARMHVNLLGDMENHLDVAQNGLEAETRRAAQLKEDASVWRLQLIVAGLSVLLILLILMGLS